MQITIDIPGKHAVLVTRAFATGGDPSSGDTPHAYDILGGEEFRRLIGMVYEADVEPGDDDHGVARRKGDVDLESPIDLAVITNDQGLALADACCRAYVRKVLTEELAREAQLAATSAAAETAETIF